VWIDGRAIYTPDGWLRNLPLLPNGATDLHTIGSAAGNTYYFRLASNGTISVIAPPNVFTGTGTVADPLVVQGFAVTFAITPGTVSAQWLWVDGLSFDVSVGHPLLLHLLPGQHEVAGADGTNYVFTVANDGSISAPALPANVRLGGATVTVTDSIFIFNGQPHPATGSVVGLNGEDLGTPTFTYYSGSSASGTPLTSPPVNVGIYTVVAAFAGNAPYGPASSTATIEILPAMPALSGTGLPSVVQQGGAQALAAGTASLPPVGGAPSLGTPIPGLASFAVDLVLSGPTITTTNPADNTVTVGWDDTANTTQTGYILMVWEHGSSSGPGAVQFGKDVRQGWFYGLFGPVNGLTQQPTYSYLRPGATYDLQLYAESARGLSSSFASATVTLTTPLIRIADSNGVISTLTAVDAFAFFDANNNHLVDGDTGSGGSFPFFPSSVGPNSTIGAGNRYLSGNGVTANVIVGYEFQDATGTLRFVAFHFNYNSATNTVTPVAVLYGDTNPGVAGANVWWGVPSSLLNMQVAPADNSGTPGIVAGTVGASVFANDGSVFTVQFSFNLGLDPTEGTGHVNP
jgi:hypothetical protein